MDSVRRSTRLRRPTSRQQLLDLESEDPYDIGGVSVEDSGDEFNGRSQAGPSRSRRKKAKMDASTDEIENMAITNRGRGRKSLQGRLSALLDMPLDVLYEVFCFLHPLDLLHLSRCSKGLRNVILRRAARTVWVSALASVHDLPDCPPDIDEPQYASLAFESYCSLCGTPGVKYVMWYHRLRTCRRCLDDTSPETLFLRYDPHPFINHDVAYAFKPLYSGLRGVRWYRPEVDEVLEVMLPLRGDPDQLAIFVEARKNEVQQRRREARALQRWSDSRISTHEVERRSAISGRRELILEKLSDLGFKREIAWMSKHTLSEQTQAFQRHKLVRSSQELTPRVWSNAKDTLIGLMEAVRFVRLLNLERETLKDRLSILTKILKEMKRDSPELIVPPLSDMVLMEPFAKALSHLIEDADQDSFQVLSLTNPINALPKLAKEWQAKKREDLLQILRTIAKPPFNNLHSAETGGTGSTFTDELDLAVAFYHCNTCYNGFSVTTYHASNMLVHECSHAEWRRGDTEVAPSILLNAAVSFCSVYPWNHFPLGIQLDNKAVAMAEAIVESCDKDPKVTTLEEMDAFDARFVCISCKDKDKANDGKVSRRVLDWRQAVEHASRVIHNAQLRRLSEDCEVLARNALNAISFADYPSWHSVWGCAHCESKRNLHVRALSIHLSNQHGIFNVTKNDFFMSCKKSFLPCTPFVRMPVDEVVVRPLNIEGISRY